MRYLIGNRFRAAIARLQQLPDCEPDDLPAVVAQIAALPSLQADLVAKLPELRVNRVQAAAVARALGNRPWSPDDRRRAGFWLAEHDASAADPWLADAKHHPTDQTPRDWRVQVWREHAANGMDLPLLMMFSAAELDERSGALGAVRSSAEEEYFLAHRACAVSPGDRHAAVRLLKAVVALGNDSTIAALFDSELLDGATQSPSVIFAFHNLDWAAHGFIKKAFLRRNPANAAATRYAALYHWAVQCYGASLQLLANAETDEQLFICAEAIVDGIVGVPEIAIAEGIADDWLHIILAREPHLALGKLEALIDLPLPPPEHPLFAIAVKFTFRKIAPLTNARDLLERFEARLDDHEPAWRSFIPPEEHAYAEIRDGLLDSRESATAAAHLEHMLSLPIDMDWGERILNCMQTRIPAGWLRYEDDTATPLADLAIDCCIRIVEELLRRGVIPGEERDRQLCSASPNVIVSTTMTLISEWRQTSRLSGGAS